MAKHKEFGGRIVSPEVFKRYVRRFTQDGVDPEHIFEHGGLLRRKDGSPFKSVKSPGWRLHKRKQELRKQDLGNIYIQETSESLALDQVKTGLEFEALTEGADVQPIIEQLDKQQHQGFSYGREFRNSCLEFGTSPSSNPDEVVNNLTVGLYAAVMAAEQLGILFSPLGTFSEEFTNEKITDDIYLKRMTLEHMGWPDSQHFIGECVQEHVGVSHGLIAALKAANRYTMVSSLIYAHTPSAPFAYGQIHPNLAEIYLREEQRERRKEDNVTYAFLQAPWDGLSIRYPARWRGSPTGGVPLHPLPETIEEYLALVHNGMRVQDITNPSALVSPGRAFGDHPDIRLRTDIAPNGTLEVANLDTMGGNISQLRAMHEYIKALMWKFQYYGKEGYLPQLGQELPQLFASEPSPQSFRISHLMNLATAKYGMEAKVITQNGQLSTMRQLDEVLIQFVDEPIPSEKYFGLSPKTLQGLIKSAQIPDQKLLDQFRDANGFVSSEGFYATSIGNLGYWLRIRSEELLKVGFSERQAIRDCLYNQGRAFHNHIKQQMESLKAA